MPDVEDAARTFFRNRPIWGEQFLVGAQTARILETQLCAYNCECYLCRVSAMNQECDKVLY